MKEDGKAIGQFITCYFLNMTVDSLLTKKIQPVYFFNDELLPKRNKVAFC